MKPRGETDVSTWRSAVTAAGSLPAPAPHSRGCVWGAALAVLCTAAMAAWKGGGSTAALATRARGPLRRTLGGRPE